MPLDRDIDWIDSTDGTWKPPATRCPTNTAPTRQPDDPVITPLDRIIERESFAEILALLTPHQLALAALLADGCTLTLAAELFGNSRQAASARLQAARDRILALRPDLARAYTAGRTHPTRRPQQPRLE